MRLRPKTAFDYGKNMAMRGLLFIDRVRDTLRQRATPLEIILAAYHQSQKVQRRFLDAQHGKVYSQLVRCALDDGVYGDAKIAVTGSMYADAVAATEVLNEYGDRPGYRHNIRDRRFVQYLVDTYEQGINWCALHRFFFDEYQRSRQAFTNAVESRASRTIERMKAELEALDDNLAIAA
jgi:hypothetical protein